jgi:hypothetical protein
MTDITITDLTNATTGDDGTGVFDILMQSVERHLEEQLDQGRITGPDYATVYLGALQSTLQQSIEFLLREQEAGHRADLVLAQKEDQEAQTQVAWYTGLATLRKQWGYEPTASEDNDVYDITSFADQGDGLIDQQIKDASNDAENKNWLTIAQLDKQWGFDVTRTLDDITDISAASSGLIDFQIQQADKQVTLLTTQTAAEAANTQLTDQKRLTEEQNTQIAGFQVTDMLPAQKLKVDADASLVTQQEALSVTNQRIAGFTGIARLEKEYGYTYTSEALASWDVATITPNDGGLMDKKILLTSAQETGFKTDSKQKILKVMMDGLAVETTTGGVPLPIDMTQDEAIRKVANSIFEDWQEGTEFIPNTPA